MADATFKKTDTLVYTGGATSRIMRKEDWEGAGVQNQDRVEWTRTEPGVKVGDMTTEAVKLMLANHPEDFEVRSDKTPAPNGD